MSFRNAPIQTARSQLAALVVLAWPAALYGLQSASESDSAPFEVVRFLAPFHSVVLHFPIGFILVLVLLELFQMRRPSKAIRDVSVILSGLAVGSCIAAASLGWLRGAGGGYEASTLELHRWSGVTVTGLMVLGSALLFRSRNSDDDAPVWKIYRGLLLATFGVVTFAGHQGGNLTHGSKYLLRNAPEFIKTYWAESPPSAHRVTGQAEQDYLRDVLPVFDAKCMRCHGESAHMSGYRLDVRENAFAGGDSGLTAIVPGDPAASNLLRVILLGRDRKGAMPPDGLNEVTAEETARLIQWIRDGAAYVPDGEALAPLIAE